MNFCVIGAGAWGTAFAVHLVRLGHTVALVPRRFEQALSLASTRENADYLPGVELPQSLQISHELKPALLETDIIFLACPMQALGEWCTAIKQSTASATALSTIVSLSKGLEAKTHRRASEIIGQVLPKFRVAALTGPTNAAEVAQKKPAAMVLASLEVDDALIRLQSAVSSSALRIYTSDDLLGVEIGACLKNIYAIAAGCCDGLSLGDNAKAALLTRALAEMVRVGQGLGARAETFHGLSGFGDLVATCNGAWSRNREFGHKIGQGDVVEKLLAGRKTVVEGYKTTEAFFELCRQRKIDAPILSEVYGILFQSKTPADALQSLMTRELKRE